MDHYLFYNLRLCYSLFSQPKQAMFIERLNFLWSFLWNQVLYTNDCTCYGDVTFLIYTVSSEDCCIKKLLSKLNFDTRATCFFPLSVDHMLISLLSSLNKQKLVKNVMWKEWLYHFSSGGWQYILYNINIINKETIYVIFLDVWTLLNYHRF